MMFAQRDALERRYDGPIPPADPARVPRDAAQRMRLFQRLAGEAREQAARRRLRLTAPGLRGDQILQRLQRDLRLYRTQGLAWRGP